MNFNVIEYWNAIKAKSGDSRHWNDLDLGAQQMIIQSINLLLTVLHSCPSANQPK
jgi:hypothetical protein